MTERNHWWTDRWLRSPLFLPFFLSFSDYLSVYLSICLSLYLSIYLSISLSLSALSVCLSIYLQAWKRSYSARLPQLNLTTSKPKQFCETSSIFELNNVKKRNISARLLQFWTWQHQKQSKSTRLPSKMESWVQRWQPRTNPFLQFFHSTCLESKVLRLPRKIDARSYEVLHLSQIIILANLQIWCSKMQPLSGN